MVWEWDNTISLTSRWSGNETQQSASFPSGLGMRPNNQPHSQVVLEWDKSLQSPGLLSHWGKLVPHVVWDFWKVLQQKYLRNRPAKSIKPCHNGVAKEQLASFPGNRPGNGAIYINDVLPTGIHSFFPASSFRCLLYDSKTSSPFAYCKLLNHWR